MSRALVEPVYNIRDNKIVCRIQEYRLSEMEVSVSEPILIVFCSALVTSRS